MATSTRAFGKPLASILLFRHLQRFFQRRFTARGRFLLVAALAVGFVSLDTRRALGFVLFALAAPPLLVALPALFARRPRLKVLGRLPSRLTAGRPATSFLDVSHLDGRATGPLSVFLGALAPRDSGLELTPAASTIELESDRTRRVPVQLHPQRRGRYELPAIGVASTDVFGLCRSRAVWSSGQVALAYPRYFTFGELALPTGRRYQPGGIPLASEVGDSLEFVGTREYREGDPLRKIHWRSWARLGKPVVREFQEEYFSRIALVLDTFLPRRPRPRERERFEAAISVLASLADHFGRSEEVVDIFAAGPDLYEVSAGRSLGHLDGVLDVLACLEPSTAPPFESVTPVLAERLARLTTVVAVLLEWDDAREAFLRRIRGMGVAVHVFLVHEGSTRKAWTGIGPELGAITLLTPAQVAARIAAEERS